MSSKFSLHKFEYYIALELNGAVLDVHVPFGTYCDSELKSCSQTNYRISPSTYYSLHDKQNNMFAAY